MSEGSNAGYLPNNAKPLSGFAGYKALKKQSKSLVFGEEAIGNGHVIYLVDNPLFRAFWYSGKVLMANAIFMTF